MVKGSSLEVGYLDEDDNRQQLARRKEQVKEMIAGPRHLSDPLSIEHGQMNTGLRGLSRLRVTDSPPGSSTPDQVRGPGPALGSATREARSRPSDSSHSSASAQILQVHRPLDPEVESLLYLQSNQSSISRPASRTRSEAATSRSASRSASRRFAPELQALLDTDSNSDSPAHRLLHAIELGKLLSQDLTTIVKLTPTIVVKFGRDMDLDEAITMTHIKTAAQSFPLPRSLGTASIGATNYHFTTFLPGQPLSQTWHRLSPAHKKAIQTQLCTLLKRLRSIPPPRHPITNQTPIGSGPPQQTRCKEFRRQVRIAPGPVTSERDFNTFLLSCPESPLPGQKPQPRTRMPPSPHPRSPRFVAPLYLSMLRGRMRTNHRLVMTHGALFRENILVECGSAVVAKRPGVRSGGTSRTGSSSSGAEARGLGRFRRNSASKLNEGVLGDNEVRVSGLVGWGGGGTYPEYWEYVRSLFLFHPGEEDDWYEHLPTKGMGEYVEEYLLDDCIDRLVMGEERQF